MSWQDVWTEVKLKSMVRDEKKPYHKNSVYAYSRYAASLETKEGTALRSAFLDVFWREYLLPDQAIKAPPDVLFEVLQAMWVCPKNTLTPLNSSFNSQLLQLLKKKALSNEGEPKHYEFMSMLLDSDKNLHKKSDDKKISDKLLKIYKEECRELSEEEVKILRAEADEEAKAQADLEAKASAIKEQQAEATTKNISTLKLKSSIPEANQNNVQPTEPPAVRLMNILNAMNDEEIKALENREDLLKKLKGEIGFEKDKYKSILRAVRLQILTQQISNECTLEQANGRLSLLVHFEFKLSGKLHPLLAALIKEDKLSSKLQNVAQLNAFFDQLISVVAKEMPVKNSQDDLEVIRSPKNSADFQVLIVSLVAFAQEISSFIKNDGLEVGADSVLHKIHMMRFLLVLVLEKFSTYCDIKGSEQQNNQSDPAMVQKSKKSFMNESEIEFKARLLGAFLTSQTEPYYAAINRNRVPGRQQGFLQGVLQGARMHDLEQSEQQKVLDEYLKIKMTSPIGVEANKLLNALIKLIMSQSNGSVTSPILDLRNGQNGVIHNNNNNNNNAQESHLKNK